MLFQNRKRRYRNTVGRRILSGAMAAIMTAGSVLGGPMSTMAATAIISGVQARPAVSAVKWSGGHSSVTVQLDARETYLAAKEALYAADEAGGYIGDTLSELADEDGYAFLDDAPLYEVALPEEMTKALGDEGFLRVFVSPTDGMAGPGAPVATATNAGKGIAGASGIKTATSSNASRVETEADPGKAAKAAEAGMAAGYAVAGRSGGYATGDEIARDLGLLDEIEEERRRAMLIVRESPAFDLDFDDAGEAPDPEESILLKKEKQEDLYEEDEYSEDGSEEEKEARAEELQEVLSYELTGKETFYIVTGSNTGDTVKWNVKLGGTEIAKRAKTGTEEGNAIAYKVPFGLVYELFRAEGDGISAEVVTLAKTKFTAKHSLAKVEVKGEDLELYTGEVEEIDERYEEAQGYLEKAGIRFDGFKLYDVSFIRENEEGKEIEYEPAGKGRIVDVSLKIEELPETEAELGIACYTLQHLLTNDYGEITGVEALITAGSKEASGRLQRTVPEETDEEEFTDTEDSYDEDEIIAEISNETDESNSEESEAESLVEIEGINAKADNASDSGEGETTAAENGAAGNESGSISRGKTSSHFAATADGAGTMSFTLGSFSLFALTYENAEEPGVDISDHPLAEVPESPDEELLSDDNISEATKALLGLGGGLRKGGVKLMSKSLRGAKGAAAEPLRRNPPDPSKKIEPEATQGAVTQDGVEISKITIRWLSKSTGQAEPAKFDDLELETDNDLVGNQQFQIDFSLSGVDDHEAGSVELVIPAWLWLDRNGEEPGNLTLSVPEDPETGADFAWRRVGDYILITNTRKISAASKVMIQGTFRNVTAHQMVDKDVAGESEYAGQYSVGRSDPFWATVSVTTPADNVISMTSNSIYATLDTHVDAASATKSAYNTSRKVYYTYHSTEDALAAGLPQEFLDSLGAEAEDYSFAKWYVASSATGSQPFTMTLTDSYNDEVVHYLDEMHTQTEILHVEGRMLGLAGDKDGNNVLSDDGETVTAVLYDGYDTYPKSAYVWTAYKKDQFPVEGDEYRIQNTQTTTVKGWDDLIETTKESTAQAPFRIPVIYTVKKVWHDEGHEERRPKHQSFGRYYNENLNTLETITVTADGGWTTSWDDDGQGWQYKVREYGMGTPSPAYEPGHEEDDAYLKDGYDITGRYHFMNIPDSEYVHTINRQYDPDGDLREYDQWWYSLEKEEYDSTTHTWTKYNKYNEKHVVRTLVPFKMQKAEVGISKSRVGYGDQNRMATSDRALNLLRKGEDVVVSYDVNGYGYIIDMTKDVDLPGTSITDFGFKDVRLELEDNYGTDTHKSTKDNTFLFDSDLRLTPEDVEVAYVSLTTPTYYRYYQPDKYSAWTFRTMTANDFAGVDRPEEELWGLQDGEWKRFAVLSVSATGSVSVTVENGASKGGSQQYINLPHRVFKVKTVMTIPGLKDAADIDRRIDGARIPYRIGVRLLAASETLQGRIAALFDANDYAMSTLENFATINAYEDEGGLTISLDDQSKSWLHGRNHREAVWATKDFRLTENDVVNRRLKMHSKVTMTQQSNILQRSDYDAAVLEGLIPHTESGIWYDLLPMAVMPDVSSVKLTNGDRLIDAYTIENYRDTGRVMLVVKADVADNVSYTYTSDPNPYRNDITFPKEGYKNVHTLEYDAYYSWDQAMLYGLDNVRNVVAYEADEDRLGNINGWSGEPDDPQANHNQRAMDAVGDDKELMTHLDEGRLNDEGVADHMAFVYAGAVLKHEEVDFAAKTELQKFVTKDGMGKWTNGRDGHPPGQCLRGRLLYLYAARALRHGYQHQGHGHRRRPGRLRARGR